MSGDIQQAEQTGWLAGLDNEELAVREALANGDLSAFDHAVRLYTPAAISYAWHMTGNREDAEDAVQEAFIRAYKGFSSFRGESSFKTWFYKVLSNVCLYQARRAIIARKIFFWRDGSGECEIDPVESAPDCRLGSMPDSEVIQKELRNELDRAILGLPGRQRAVFLLKHNEGLKGTEIAEVLGITEGAVKAHISRAVETLRKKLKEHEGYVRDM